MLYQSIKFFIFSIFCFSLSMATPNPESIQIETWTQLLTDAVNQDNADLVDDLLNNDDDVKTSPDFLSNLLLSVCTREHKLNSNANAVAMLLLTYGANVNHCDENSTPLIHHLVLNLHISLIYTFQQHHVNICLPNREGQTVLHLLAMRNGENDQEMCDLLIIMDATLLSTTDINGLTPEQLARLCGNDEIADYIVGIKHSSHVTRANSTHTFTAPRIFAPIRQQTQPVGPSLISIIQKQGPGEAGRLVFEEGTVEPTQEAIEYCFQEGFHELAQEMIEKLVVINKRSQCNRFEPQPQIVRPKGRVAQLRNEASLGLNNSQWALFLDEEHRKASNPFNA